MRRVYLAPHLDDAVLSCGSAIHRHRAAGEGVRVVTVLAGEAGRDTTLLGFAREQHAQRGGAVELAMTVAEAGGWLKEPVVVEATHVAAEVSAVSHFRSQMANLFGGTEAMPGRVWAFAAAHAPGACLAERVWWPQ